MDCDDDCNEGLDCKNKKSTNVHMEKLDVRETKDGKGKGLFAIEDFKKDEYVIEYMGKIEY